MRARSALAVAATVALGLAVPVRAEPPCANAIELRNQWTAVTVPSGTRDAVAMDQADDDPCVMVATDLHRDAFRSTDGGRTWTTIHPPGDPELVRPVMATLAQHNVALVVAPSSGGGLLVSHDSGLTYAKATGLDGVQVVSLRGDRLTSGRVYASVRRATTLPVAVPSQAPALPSSGPSIYVSNDFGGSWTPLPGSSAIASANIAVDAVSPNLVWTDNANAAGGVWLSDDSGSTFVSKDPTATRDVDTSALPGGGAIAVTATAKGVRSSRDGGNSWTATLDGENVHEVVFEHGHPSATMLVANGTVERSSDSAGSTRDQAKGLPQGCDPHGLTADATEVSTFLVVCAKDGRTYRYRSDGSDLDYVDDGGPGDATLLFPELPHSEMELLAEHGLPADDDGQSGAVAFDGQLVYYTDAHDGTRIHRIDASTGSAVPDLVVGFEKKIRGLAYNSLTHVLYVLDDSSVMYSVDIETGKATVLFDATENTQTGTNLGYASFTFDATIGMFRAVTDGGGVVYEVNTAGEVEGQCTMPQVLVVRPANGAPPDASQSTTGAAAVVSSGDGGVYVQMEDNATVVRFDRSCRPLAFFNHRDFSEAPMENDQIACDTNTFDQPAVWLRDAQLRAVVAYAVPGGYCALATTLRVTTSPTVANTESAPICAELRLAGKRTPIAGEAVTMYAGDHEVGTGRTDRTGVACATYHPSDFPEHVSPAPPKAGEAPIDKRDREQVVANYLGTIAYRPARALGHAVVTTFVEPLSPPPGRHLPAVPPQTVPEAAVVAAPPPPLPVSPPQPPPPASQPQPLAQGHPGAQPGALGQPGAAPHQEDEVEAADQAADVVREFRARAPLPNSTMPVAVVAFTMAAALLEQRRRHSRVREAGT
jgi:hypothetical protein